MVISPPAHMRAGGDVFVVAISTSVGPEEWDRVAMPNRQTEPRAKSGLSRPCWAVPRWYLPVRRSRLTDRAGYIDMVLVEEIYEAVLKRSGPSSLPPGLGTTRGKSSDR